MEPEIKKILILRFGALGDVVHTSCLFHSLKRQHPDLSVHYLTFKEPSLLIENDKSLERIWVADNKSYKCLNSLAKALRKEKFDLFMNLQPSIRTKIFSLMLSPKKVLTYKKDFSLHATENFWRTAKPLFKEMGFEKELKVYLPEKSLKKAVSLLPANKKQVAFITEVSPTREGRLWPAEYWKDLAKNLISKYNCEILLTGTEKNIPRANEITAVSAGIKSFCGKLNIQESAALLARCSLVISGDTGPLHIASGLGVPVIGLYGAMPVSRTGPLGCGCYTLVSERKCVPCNKRKCKYLKKNELFTPCMSDIKSDYVFKLIENNKLL